MSNGSIAWKRAARGLVATAGCLLLPGCAPRQEPRPAPRAALRPRLLSWRVATAYLEDAFQEIPNSSIDDFRRGIPGEEREKVNAAQGKAAAEPDRAWIYGEPAPASSDLIFRRLALGEKDVLYDLGCGRGFFLFQALLTTPVPRVVGVELAHSRLEIGRQAQAVLAREGLLPPDRVVDLREEDIAGTDLRDATVVFMDSVFFSDELLSKVAGRMAQAPDLRAVVMISKGLPPNPWFDLEATERWKMSWSPKFGTEVLFYRRSKAPAP